MNGEVGILDIGLGNIRSVANAVYEVGFDYTFVQNPSGLVATSHLIVPGVGHFGTAMEKLAPFMDALNTYRHSGRPILGICLGMQLFATWGEEGGCAGLGWIAGTIKRFSSAVPVPHVGWDSVAFTHNHPVLREVPQECDFYFTHSYHYSDAADENVLGVTEYDVKFPSVVCRENLVATQFHPEKSQKNGLQLLENFCGWNGAC